MFTMDPRKKWNRAPIELEENERFSISVAVSEDYADRHQPADANGWLRQGPSVLRALVAVFRLQRIPHVGYFVVTGCFGRDESQCFEVGEGGDFQAKQDSELYFFVNDVGSMYGNNKGHATITLRLK